MTPPNGHADSPAANPAAQQPPSPAAVVTTATGIQFTSTEIRGLIAKLEVPFHPSVIEWRVTNTTKNGSSRGQVIPYADQRAYTDRLNDLFTPAGWTRKYEVHTSPNFQRGKEQKTVAKVFVTCELTVFGLGSHSATGEEWADDENAGTSAEAQAFKRACSCFGLGRYLYHFDGVWVDLDDRKRPKKIPPLPKWATPQGWLQGLRPGPPENGHSSGAAATPGKDSGTASSELVRQIEAMAQPLGRRLYRGLLRTLAKVWAPNQIHDVSLQQKVLEHMQSAQRGLGRLRAALAKTGPAALTPILRSLQLTSLDQVDNLDVLKKIVLAIEESAAKTRC
jgi:hypothetical protein